MTSRHGGSNLIDEVELMCIRSTIMGTCHSVAAATK